MEIMVDTWRKMSHVCFIRNSIIDEEYLHLSSAPLQVPAHFLLMKVNKMMNILSIILFFLL